MLVYLGKICQSTKTTTKLDLTSTTLIIEDEFLVSKETVLLRRWERSKQKFGFIKRVDKGWITTVNDLERWRFEREPFVRANRGIVGCCGLNQKIFHGGNSTFINSFDKTKFLFISIFLVAKRAYF